MLQTRLHHNAAVFHRADLTLLRGVQLLVRLEIRNPVHACRHECAAFLRPDAVQPHDVIGILGPAALHERTLVRLVALQADRNVGQRTVQHLEQRIDFPAHLAEQRLHRCGYVGALEEIRQIGEMAFLVEVHDVHARDTNPALLEDMDLHGRVGKVLLFLGRR